MKVAASLSDKKIDITRRLLEIEDQLVLDQIYDILLHASDIDVDWFEKLDEEDKKDVRQGYEDIAAGRVSEQDEMMERIKACIRK